VSRGFIQAGNAVKSRLFGMLLGLLLSACAGGGGGESATQRAADPPVAAADINLLFLGNSHTHFHDLPGMVAELVRAARPGKSVHAEAAPGYLFLDERLHDPATLRLLNSRRWSAVVLQAQRYSSSGLFSYSTSEAEALARMSRNLGATPMMFPEWPRQGIAETARIYDLHAGIARTGPACLAPVGQAWEVALTNAPNLVLHDADGNHSAPSGALLAAMVLAASITGADPGSFPFLPQRNVDAATQQQLRAAAREAVNRHPPRALCPGDPLLP
jgi:hypothetical protein